MIYYKYGDRMEATLEIVLLNCEEFTFDKKYDVIEDIDGKVKFIIYTSWFESFNSVITNYDELRKRIFEICKELNESNFDGEFDEYLNFLKHYVYKNNKYFEDLFTHLDTISIRGSSKDVLGYIRRNKDLLNKKIIYSEYLRLGDSKLDKIKTLFKDMPNFFVRLEGNDEIINIKELEDTLSIIDKMAGCVKKYNFSPLEEIIYIYDKVRDRVYLEESNLEDKCVSRDLSKVLLGDKIVCKGYANIFNAILKKLGYKVRLYDILKNELVNGKRIGHVRNIVYLKDDKYNIDGVYFFDTTWDSKRSISDNNYLYSYKYFAKTKKDIESFKLGKYSDYTMPSYNETMICDFHDIVKEKGLLAVPRDMINTINYLSRFIDGNTLITSLMLVYNTNFSLDDVMEKLFYYDELLNKPIYADTLLKALYNVRKIEYYENDGKYPFDIKAFYSAVVNSNWIFKSNASGLLMAIFGCQFSKKLTDDTRINMNKFIKNNELDLNIERVKLTKTLRKVLIKKLEDK